MQSIVPTIIRGFIRTTHTFGGKIILNNFSEIDPVFYELKFIPNNGFAIYEVIINGVDKGAIEKYKFEDTQLMQNVYVIFKEITVQHKITAAVHGNGEISYQGESYILEGQSKYYKFYPNIGYEFDKLLINGVSVESEGEGYNFFNVKKDCTIDVYFKFSGTIFTLNGKIKDESGNGIENVNVNIDNVYYSTHSDGRFTLENIKKGTKILSATKGGYENFFDRISLTENKNDYVAVLKKLPATYRVTGKIKDEKGYSIPYVTVSIDGCNAVTDGEGIYEVSGILSGTYTLYISKSGYYSKSMKDLKINSDLSFINLTIIQIPSNLL